MFCAFPSGVIPGATGSPFHAQLVSAPRHERGQPRLPGCSGWCTPAAARVLVPCLVLVPDLMNPHPVLRRGSATPLRHWSGNEYQRKLPVEHGPSAGALIASSPPHPPDKRAWPSPPYALSPARCAGLIYTRCGWPPFAVDPPAG